MKAPLTLSKEDHEKVLRMVAEMLFKQLSFDPEELIVISTATVSQCTGLQAKSVPRRLPITTVSTQKQGVLLSTLREFLRNNTRPPSA
jgi:hypothetical protein